MIAFHYYLFNQFLIFFLCRVWRVFSILDPETAYNASPADDFTLPFSINPAQPITPEDLMRVNRDHYEGTPYDMTVVCAK